MARIIHGRRSFRLLLVALLFPALHSLTPSASAQENPQDPAQTIRVSVDRVNVGVIVTGAGGRLVEGLRREDFRVFDNGVEQPITGFLSIDEPAQVLLLIESGPAVLFLGKNHLQAADAFMKGLSPADRVAIASYDRSPESLLDFTPDKAAARSALQGLNFFAGFGDLYLSFTLAPCVRRNRRRLPSNGFIERARST